MAPAFRASMAIFLADGPGHDDHRNLPKPLPGQGQGGQAVESRQGIVGENEIGAKCSRA